MKITTRFPGHYIGFFFKKDFEKSMKQWANNMKYLKMMDSFNCFKQTFLTWNNPSISFRPKGDTIQTQR